MVQRGEEQGMSSAASGERGRPTDVLFAVLAHPRPPRPPRTARAIIRPRAAAVRRQRVVPGGGVDAGDRSVCTGTDNDNATVVLLRSPEPSLKADVRGAEVLE